MRRSLTALWLCLGALIVAVGFVMVALPWTTELAAIDDDSVSTVLPVHGPPDSSSTTTTVRPLEDLSPAELAAFSEYVNPTTTTTAAPTTTTTMAYLPPTTYLPVATEAPLPEVQVAPAPEPEPLPEVVPEAQPSYSGGCVIPAYICQRESGMSYTALNPSSGAGGMYQFMPSTWNGAARQSGHGDWVGIPPHTAAPWMQDTLAAFLWAGGAGCSHWSACG